LPQMQVAFLLNDDDAAPDAPAPVTLSAEYLYRLTSTPATQTFRSEFGDPPVVPTANDLMARFNALAAQPGVTSGRNPPMQQVNVQANVWAAQLPGYGTVLFSIDAQDQIHEIRRPPNASAAAVSSTIAAMKINAAQRVHNDAVRAQAPQREGPPQPAVQQQPAAQQPFGVSAQYLARLGRASRVASSLAQSFNSRLPVRHLIDGVTAAAGWVATQPGAATGPNPSVRQVHQGRNIWAFDVPNDLARPNLLNRPFTALLLLDPTTREVIDMRCGDAHQFEAALMQLNAAAARRQ
jgi:hypothetical protein